PDPGGAVVRLENELAAARPFDVLGGGRNTYLEQHAPGDLDVLAAEMPAVVAECAQHAGPAEDLCLQRRASRAGGDDAFDQRPHCDIAEARRLRAGDQAF